MIEKNSADKSLERKLEEFVASGARDLDHAESLVEEALLAGAEEAEVFLKTSATTGIFLQDGFATLAGGNERGVALRVFDARGRWGHAYASWGDPDLNRRLAQSALAALRDASSGPIVGAAPAPRPPAPFPEIDGIIASQVLEATPADKRATLEKALREASPGSGSRLGTSLRDGISRVALVNSRGVKAYFHRTLALLTLTLSGGEGPTLVAERVGCGIGPEEVTEAAEEILGLQGSVTEEVVVPGDILLRSSAAPALMRWLEREILAGDTDCGSEGGGRKVASEAVDLADDPLLPAGVASSPFDGEGYPTLRTTLLKSGIRIGSLGRKCGGLAGGRGHSVRPSYRDLPAPGGTNLVVVPGRRGWTEILQGIERGFLLAALDGDAPADQPTREAQWRGIGWEIRDGAAVGICRRFLFRAAPRKLLEGVLETSDSLRFSLYRSTALGCCDLLIRLRA